MRRWVGLVRPATKQSPIANYVYCKWLRDTQSRTTDQGEKRDKSTGSEAATAAHKYCTSWNEMRMWIEELIQFLQASSATYTEFDDVNPAEVRRLFPIVNPLGI
ncbi:MAG: hypothetical protein EOP83_23585 [Verrucomicrobiaceae bacterium]|nr:MAG: hypothetical protein EOP83_23585 [Verrucomicrobiaceae bacterium]